MRPSKTLAKLGACENAIKWSRSFSTHQAAWTACERADWLLWCLGELVDLGRFDRKRLVLLACQCARTALTYVKAGESRPLNAIETAEAWARGDAGVTLADVTAAANGAAHSAYTPANAAHSGGIAAANAANAAYTAATAAGYGAAYGAAYTAANAAYTAATAAGYGAAYGAAYTPANAAYTANPAGYSAVLAVAHQKMCDMIRAEVPDIRAVKENEK